MTAVRLMRVAGIDFYFHPLFAVLLALFFLAGLLPRALVIFSLVLVHEAAHVLIARRLGIPVPAVELLPFGGVARMGSEMVLSPRTELKIALAGPACNLILLGLYAGLANNHMLPLWWPEDAGRAFISWNLSLALVNLLPALPLDGGRIYRALLAGRIGLRAATYRAASAGQKWGVLLALAGTAGLFIRAAGPEPLLLGLFLFYAAGREKTAAPYLLLGHLLHQGNMAPSWREIGVVPARLLIVRASTPLGVLLRYLVPEKMLLLYIVGEDGSWQGPVGEERFIKTLLARGYDCPAAYLLQDNSE